jgi:hypothetical protein
MHKAGAAEQTPEIKPPSSAILDRPRGLSLAHTAGLRSRPVMVIDLSVRLEYATRSDGWGWAAAGRIAASERL